MRGLRTARVLVVDDEPSDAEPLLRGLAKLGVGSLYFNGDVDDLPDRPFRGVRLVFLDLRLGAGLTDTPHALGHTITVLKRLVSPTKGETAIILWTKHAEDASEFSRVLQERWPEFQPAFSVTLAEKIRFVQRATDRPTLDPGPSTAELAVQAEGESQTAANANEAKSEVVPYSVAGAEVAASVPLLPSTDATSATPLGIDELRDRITKALTDDAYRLLWEWEQCIHDAASATVGILLAMKAKRANIPLMTVLARLAQAPGQSIIDHRTALAGLFEGLNPVHADNLRRLARQDDATGPHIDALLALLQGDKLAKLEQPEYALLNRFILADVGGTGSPYPGDVFLAREWTGTFPGGPIDETKKRLLAEVFKDLKPEDPASVTAELCLTEITAACDFAQGKAYNARLIYGLLIEGPGTNAGNAKLSIPENTRNFARDTEFIRIDESGLAGDYRLVMNARWICSISVADLAKQKAVVRLRDQLITDIRAWFASHASRPGYVSLR